MNEFFKVKVTYLAETEPGTTTSKKEEFLIESVNYKDAEETAYHIIEHYALNQFGEATFIITKVKSPELCIPDQYKGNETLNDMAVVSFQENDFETEKATNGLYVVKYAYINLEGKVQTDEVLFYVEGFNQLHQLIVNFIDKYHRRDDVVIKNIKKSKVNTLIILEETYESATLFYQNIKN